MIKNKRVKRLVRVTWVPQRLRNDSNLLLLIKILFDYNSPTLSLIRQYLAIAIEEPLKQIFALNLNTQSKL